MALIDTYRSNAVRKREEITRLQQDKAREQAKIPVLSSKINNASQALPKIKIASSVTSKINEIHRYQKEQADVEKKIAGLELKISQKHKELNDELKRVSLEEDKEQKKRALEAQKQAREYTQRMSQVDRTIAKHEFMHRSTLSTLERMQRLPEKIVVLFLAANPIDQAPLRLDEEARAITDIIRKSKHRDSVQLETRWAVQPVDLLQAINELNPTIVHFSGHGSEDDEIIFQDSNGNAKPVSMGAIVQTMMASSGDLRVVFFNTCFSFNQAEAVTKYVEAAIGMNTSIGDIAARMFASQFYSAIGFGLSVQRAFDQARALVMLEGIPEENTPELFVQAGLSADDIIIVRPD